MKIRVDGQEFATSYFPFFRMEIFDDFQVWGIRLPSGKVEDVLIFDTEQPLAGLADYMEYLIREYILEDDIALTPKAIEFKKDLEELFDERQRKPDDQRVL